MRKFLFIFFIVLFSIPVFAGVHMLTTLEEHRSALRESLMTARAHVTIISPYISDKAIIADGLEDIISRITATGVPVSVYTDSKLDMSRTKYGREELKECAFNGREILKKAGAHLFIVNDVHAKVVIKDDEEIICGSFNWLSAVRSGSHFYAPRDEYSTRLVGEVARDPIYKVRQAIEKCTIVHTFCSHIDFHAMAEEKWRAEEARAMESYYISMGIPSAAEEEEDRKRYTEIAARFRDGPPVSFAADFVELKGTVTTTELAREAFEVIARMPFKKEFKMQLRNDVVEALLSHIRHAEGYMDFVRVFKHSYRALAHMAIASLLALQEERPEVCPEDLDMLLTEEFGYQKGRHKFKDED